MYFRDTEFMFAGPLHPNLSIAEIKVLTFMGSLYMWLEKATVQSNDATIILKDFFR